MRKDHFSARIGLLDVSKRLLSVSKRLLSVSKRLLSVKKMYFFDRKIHFFGRKHSLINKKTARSVNYGQYFRGCRGLFADSIDNCLSCRLDDCRNDVVAVAFGLCLELLCQRRAVVSRGLQFKIECQLVL